jgi:hypothetical protein
MVLGKLACLVLSKILGIGTAERNWKQVKKIKDRDHSNLGPKVTSMITNVDIGLVQHIAVSVVTCTAK